MKINFLFSKSPWYIILIENSLKNIQNYTRTEILHRSGNNYWKILGQLNTFIFVLYIRGDLFTHNHSVCAWYKTTAAHMFLKKLR